MRESSSLLRCSDRTVTSNKVGSLCHYVLKFGVSLRDNSGKAVMCNVGFCFEPANQWSSANATGVISRWRHWNSGVIVNDHHYGAIPGSP